MITDPPTESKSTANSPLVLTKGQRAQIAAYVSGIDDTTDVHRPEHCIGDKGKDAKDEATT